ncbi:uncharacterized protein BDR25DRAFT_301869 [Lindgomyces ingoldianus]|uniref:Uncharacterized protein n=1 Tax=Lindgomyces ingoldianus TaxID=673940 RepID=A0ACB6R3S8_9PLEO|nr:uncharacterized protein BDR25DRAFT_301869 [Lindgomyces ingoldianus]KAF2473717.1 hypothetical protein BDR25DRAFT_301869 [Lindgomyces ingoldianus]
MTQRPQPLRFVGPPVPRARPIPPSKWDEHKEELRSLYEERTLEDLMEFMKRTHSFEPSHRQYIYKFEKWGFKKYNTGGRETLQRPPIPPRLQHQLSVSAPERSLPNYPLVSSSTPKRPKSMGSLQSRGSQSSMDRPTVPPKKRQKLAEYIASRDPFADPEPDLPAAPAHDQDQYRATPSACGAPQMPYTGTAGTSQSTSPTYLGSSPRSALSSGLGAKTSTVSNTPGLIEDDSDWITINEQSDNDPLLSKSLDNLENLDFGKTPSLPLSVRLWSPNRRRFDSSRPIHTFSQEELTDMKLAAHFLQSLGFDSDAFELFTILLKRLKEPNTEPSWMRSSALISCVRSSFLSSQVEIARNELFKTLDEPRDTFTDVEHFIYRMLLAETYTRSDDKDSENFISEIAIGCELASDKMFDHLPAEHRSFDLLTYHYLNKCLEYLNTFVQDDWDQGSIFTDKEHLQIRILERIPGPFELRQSSMKNPLLRSCLTWCAKELSSITKLPDSWKAVQSDDDNYVYWTDHIGLYCGLWERWQAQRRDCFGSALAPWMLDTERLMGITPAELLSITCGLIMSAAPPRTLQSDLNLIIRARSGAATVSRLSDKDLGCQFLDTYSLLGTLFGSAPQRQYHDWVSFFAMLVNSTRERETFGDKARGFVRDFIEGDLNIILPGVPRDEEPGPSRQDSDRISPRLSENARRSMENLAATLLPTLASSIHSSELSAMRSLRDQIQQATRRSIDRAPSWGVGRLASQSHATIPTVSELSQAMASTLSLSSAQQAANAALDAIASASSDIFGMFSDVEVDGDPFSERYGEVVEG